MSGQRLKGPGSCNQTCISFHLQNVICHGWWFQLWTQYPGSVVPLAMFSSYLANVVHWEFLEGREERSEKDHNLKIKSDEFMTILWWWFYDGMMIWWRNDFLMMIPLWGEVCWCWCTPRWGKSRRRVGTDCAIGMGTKMFSLRDCPTRGGGGQINVFIFNWIWISIFATFHPIIITTWNCQCHS